MRLSIAINTRIASLLLLVFVLLTGGFARERGPRVEVLCPAPPIPVRIDQQQVLVYELYVTNFDSVPLTLKRLEVFAGEGESRPLRYLCSPAKCKHQGAFARAGPSWG